MTCDFGNQLQEAKQLIADFANEAQEKGLIDMSAVPGFAVPTLLMGGGVPTITVTGENDTLVSTTNAAEYTFSDVSGLGSHTEVFLLITIRGSASIQTVTGLTVEGVAATKKSELSNGSQRAEIWAISSSVATPDIVITLSGTAANIKCFAIGTTGASLTATDTGTSNADPAALDVDTVAKGLVLACGISTGATSMTWTGVTEKYDTTPETQTHTGGYFATTTAETPRTVSGNWAGSSTWAAVSASFGPASAPSASRILDGYSNVTGAWSISRLLKSSWGDTARYTTDVGINQLSDQSGNGNHLTNATGANQPTLQTSIGPQARSVARFDGSNDRLTCVNAASSLITVSAGYIVMCGILKVVDTNDATIDNNDIAFTSLSHGFFFKNSAGTYSWHVANNDGGGHDTATANFASSPIDQVIVCEWRHESGTLYGRVTVQGGSPGAWQSVASGDTTSLITALRIGTSVAATQIEFFEGATMSSVQNDTLRDALVANMLAHYG